MKCKCLLLCGVLLLCLNACKKEEAAPPPTTGSLLLGKWQLSKSASQLFSSSNKLLSSTTSTSFTADDFVEYYMDGTGYYSEATPSGISLSEFTYTLNGTALTEFNSVELKGIPGTITSISTNALVIHVVLLVSDPNDPDATDTEINDNTYSR